MTWSEIFNFNFKLQKICQDIIREYKKMVKEIEHDPEQIKLKSISHVYETLKSLCVSQLLPWPEEPIVRTLAKLATTKAAKYLKAWAQIHSVMSYVAVFHIWNSLMGGASVFFQIPCTQGVEREQT